MPTKIEKEEMKIKRQLLITKKRKNRTQNSDKINRMKMYVISEQSLVKT